MKRSIGWLLRPVATSATETRIRRGILLVVTAVVALTALPVLLLSFWEGYQIEQKRVEVAAEFIARNLRHELTELRRDITGMAAAPIVATALTDSAGREGYLRPFLAQRAEALQVGITLRDYRGRPLLRLRQGDGGGGGTPSAPRPITEPAERFTEDGYEWTAPITMFLDNRVIGALEAQAPWSVLLQRASRGLETEVQLALFRGATLVDAGPGPLTVDQLPHRIAVTGLSAAADLELAYGALPGRFTGLFGRIAAMVLMINMVALLLASQAARSIARSLTTPLARLVAASRRFSLGEMPDLSDVRDVREIAELGDALANAFAARDQAQREIRLHTEHLLEGLPVVVFSGHLSAEGDLRVDYISPGVTRVFGWAPEELANREDFAAKVSAEDLNGVRDFMRRLNQTGTMPEPLEFALHRQDGTTAWVSLLARVTEREGDTAVVAGTLVDVTRERALRAQAINAAKLSTLGEMATGLAHELNQPVAVMSLAAENTRVMLERQGARRIPEALERMDRIAGQAARVRAIIDHLRVFARGDEGTLEPIRLSQVVEGATILVGGQLRQAGIEPRMLLPDDLPPVMARLVLAEQALVNLLLNARDALVEAGTADPEIRVVAEISADQVVLKVQDNGPGFPPGALDRLFEPFFTTKDVGKGTGLGLSICHGIMRSFGGGIAGGTSPMGGAELRLYFRRAETAPKTVTASEPTASAL